MNRLVFKILAFMVAFSLSMANGQIYSADIIDIVKSKDQSAVVNYEGSPNTTGQLINAREKAGVIMVDGRLKPARQGENLNIRRYAAQFKVNGQVVMQTGKPVAGVMIRVFNRNLRTEDFLGDAVTNAAGRYEIQFTLEKSERSEKETVDLIARAYNKADILLAESAIHYNVPRETVINLIVSESTPSAPSEYDELLNSF